MGDSITAMVLAARRADYLFIRDDLAPLHHDHAACHELAHLLAGHVDDKFSGLSPLGDATVRGMSLNRDYTYSDQQELEAEAIATLIMEQVTGRVEVHAPDPGTERAARAFGHALS